MLVAIITVKETDQIAKTINSCEHLADVFELRVDYLTEINFEQLNKIRNTIQKPIIFTLRSVEDKGAFKGAELERLAILKKLGALNPDYIDFESHVAEHFISEFHNKYPNIKIIRSYHNFNDTPDNLDDILNQLKHQDCSVYKIVTHANSSLDCIRMIHFVKKHSNKIKIVGHCMGETGIPSRVLGATVGNVFCYASLNNTPSPAPGCLSLNEFIEIYRIQQLNQDTEIFALLGDPVAKSIGHKFHNKKSQENNKNAVYLKIKLTKDELKPFFKSIKGLNFKGFSVTMPLKEAVLPFIQHVENNSQELGAINTLRIDDDQLSGLNTDGIGALDAICENKNIDNKKLLILGAGGAAKAIAFEARNRNANISIINRTLDKAKVLAIQVKGKAYDLSSPSKEHYDFIINTVPSDISNANELVAAVKNTLSPDTIYMDINYYQPLAGLFQLAEQTGSQIVDGYKMFENQALLQLDFWQRGQKKKTSRNGSSTTLLTPTTGISF